MATAAPPSHSDPFHVAATSFAGVVASQTWADYFLWELILNDNPDLRLIAEIGTWQGGFSRYLWAQAYLREMAFVTWDAIEPPDPPPNFEQLDVFAEPEVVLAFCEDLAPSILFCDGGNKPRELKHFGRALGKEHVLVVHDWLTEVFPEDVPDELEMVYEDVCDILGSMSRLFRKKA